jgi:segregation and condensation protein A
MPTNPENEFEIKLPLFEGPFDLLLFFIERNEIDIYDIPIAQITQDFLNYIEQMQYLNIELASEFILVAATLMKIKARMLIPKEVENPEEDPRQELIDYLLEYRKYKSVLEVLEDLEEEQFKKIPRGSIEQELKQIAKIHSADYELHNLDLYKLLKVYENLLHQYEKAQNAPTHTIVPYPYSVEGQKEYIIQRLAQTSRLSFRDTLRESPNKMTVIFNFLAILELIQNRMITLHLGEGFNDFWVEKVAQQPEKEII